MCLFKNFQKKFIGIYNEFCTNCDTMGVSGSLETLYGFLIEGMDRPATGIAREDPVTCAECKTCLFKVPEDHVGTRLCLFCDRWVHSKCSRMHHMDHIVGALCLGFRRRTDRVLNRPSSQGCAPSVSPAAPADGSVTTEPAPQISLDVLSRTR